MDYHRPMPPPPPYAMLSEQGGRGYSMNLQPPPQRRNLPRYHSGYPVQERSFCRRCCCWFCCVLILVFILIGAALVYVFVIYKPTIPTYSINDLSVGSLNINPQDQTLQLQLIVTVKAENPNSMIGIWYDPGSEVFIEYRNSTLCSGRLPSFYQGFHKTALMKVEMHGESKLASGITKALQENMKTGETPLDVFVKVPVRLRLGSVDMRQVKVNVHCKLVMGGLSPNEKADIKSADYDVDVEF